MWRLSSSPVISWHTVTPNYPIFSWNVSKLPCCVMTYCSLNIWWPIKWCTICLYMVRGTYHICHTVYSTQYSILMLCAGNVCLCTSGATLWFDAIAPLIDLYYLLSWTCAFWMKKKANTRWMSSFCLIFIKFTWLWNVGFSKPVSKPYKNTYSYQSMVPSCSAPVIHPVLCVVALTCTCCLPSCWEPPVHALPSRTTTWLLRRWVRGNRGIYRGHAVS